MREKMLEIINGYLLENEEEVKKWCAVAIGGAFLDVKVGLHQFKTVEEFLEYQTVDDFGDVVTVEEEYKKSILYRIQRFLEETTWELCKKTYEKNELYYYLFKRFPDQKIIFKYREFLTRELDIETYFYEHYKDEPFSSFILLGMEHELNENYWKEERVWRIFEKGE